MKKLLILLLTCTTLFLFSCTKKKHNLKVGFSFRSFKIDRCARERDFFLERAKQLGIEVIISDADENELAQIRQSIDMLNQNIDVLIVFPINLITSATIIREAHKKGIKVIAYESIILGCELDYFISADNYKGGQLMGKYVIENYPQGNYVFLGGNKLDKNAILIKEGQHEVIDPELKKGKINILYDIYSDWTADEGFMETNRFLSLSGTIPDVIIASNDGLATGVVEALKQEGLTGKVGVTGLDCELIALRRIAKGTQSMTIFKSFKKEAYAAAELAFQLAKQEKPQNISAETFNGVIKVPTILIDPEIVTKDNIKEIIKKDNIYTEKDIYDN